MRCFVFVLAFTAGLSGCGSPASPTVLVSAAASLTDAFEEIEAVFESRYPDVDVVLNLAGSSALREQILAGAPADVFASANESVMSDLAGAGLLEDSAQIFATNRLEIAVPPGNPASLVGLVDFGRAELLLGVCAAGVPCGDFAEEALRNADVDPEIDTFEPNVRSLLTKVESADLDAGIVYVTDVRAARGRVGGIPIAADLNVSARYPVAMLRDADHPDAAAAFVAFVLSPDGRQILSDHGFGGP